MKTKNLIYYFFLVSCIAFLSCNDASKDTRAEGNASDTSASGGSTMDTTGVQQFPTTAGTPLDEKLVEFQDKLDLNLTEVNVTKDLIADTLEAVKDLAAKRNLQKAKLNLTYLANSLVRAKVDYLVNDLEKINTNFGAQISEASASFNKIGTIAVKLTKINKGITQLVKIGKVLITKGLVKV
jgi:hypothetical protein